MNHIPALDGLRGFAIIGLVLSYTGFCPGGWIGVVIFLTLSGYLITMTLLKEYQRNISESQRTSRVNLRRFYWRRGLRLLPALFAFVTTAALYTFYFKRLILLPSNLEAIFFVSNWTRKLSVFPQDVLSQIWPLAVLGLFYILWPLFLVWQLKRRIALKSLGLLILTAIFILYGSRFYFSYLSTSKGQIFENLDLQVSALLTGCLLAVAVKAKLLNRRRRYLSLICLAVLGAIFVVDPPIILSLLIAPWLTAAVIFGAPHALALRPLVCLGQISYSLSLWSFSITEIFQPALNNSLFFVGACLVISAISYYLLEKPFLNRTFDLDLISEPHRNPVKI